MSLVTFGFGLGLAAGPLVTGALAGYLGFAAPFYVFAGLSSVAAATVWPVARESVGAAPAPGPRTGPIVGAEEPRRAG